MIKREEYIAGLVESMDTVQELVDNIRHELRGMQEYVYGLQRLEAENDE